LDLRIKRVEPIYAAIYLATAFRRTLERLETWGQSVDIPKKWWWVAGVAVPVVVALIAVIPQLVSTPGGKDDAAEIVYNEVAGNQYQGGVAYSTVNFIARQFEQTSGQPLPADVRAVLTDAMAAIDDGDFDKAIPLFEAAADTISSSGLLNNLGAAYIAAGETERARDILVRALGAVDTSPQQAAAVLHNIRQIASTRRTSGQDRRVATEWPGVVAEITRLDTTSGLLTLEVEYDNTTAQQVPVCIQPSTYKLIDEVTAQSWRPQHYHGNNCQNNLTAGFLEPGERYIAWAKYRLKGEVPDTLTVILSGVPRPVEGLKPGLDDS